MKYIKIILLLCLLNKNIYGSLSDLFKYNIPKKSSLGFFEHLSPLQTNTLAGCAIGFSIGAYISIKHADRSKAESLQVIAVITIIGGIIGASTCLY